MKHGLVIFLEVYLKIGLILESIHDISYALELIKKIVKQCNQTFDYSPNLIISARGYPNIKKYIKNYIDHLKRNNAEVIIVLADNDRTKRDKRLNTLKEKVSKNANFVVIGIAVQSLEAWLLADYEILNRIVVKHVPPVHNTETIKNPKREFQSLLAQQRYSHTELGKQIAKGCRKPKLDRRNRSFKRFHYEIRDKIACLE